MMEIKLVETDKELNHVYAVRKTVFVEEQNVPAEMEIDQYEAEAVHFVCYDKEGTAIGAARLRLFSDYGKLERICVLQAYRGQNIGKAIIRKMEDKIRQENIWQATLNAQTHAIDFYKKIGYEVVSQPFMDAGIPHVTMEKQLDS